MAEKSKLDAALDELLNGKSTEEIVGQGGVLKQRTKEITNDIRWFVYFRVYGPEQAAFDGSWKPGDFEEVK